MKSSYSISITAIILDGRHQVCTDNVICSHPRDSAMLLNSNSLFVQNGTNMHVKHFYIQTHPEPTNITHA